MRTSRKTHYVCTLQLYVTLNDMLGKDGYLFCASDEMHVFEVCLKYDMNVRVLITALSEGLN